MTRNWGKVLLMVCMTTIGCSSENAQPTGKTPAAAATGTIVAFGDSLTEGYGLDESEAWPALLETRLKENGYQWQVVNAGVSGETSQGARSRVEWILKMDPDIVILETGANDGMRGMDPKVTEANLDAIVSTLKGRGVRVVLAGMKMLTSLGAPFTRSFEAVYPNVAERHGLILIPFILEGVAGKRALNLYDGIHPNADGHRIMTDTVYPYVLEAVKG